MTLAFGVLREGGVCARVDGAVVDLSGLDPVLAADSLNPFMAAGPEVWRQVAARVGEGREVAAGEDEPLMLALTVAIDEMTHRG